MSSHISILSLSISPQIRFLMKSYSFMRETAPAIIKNVPKEGTIMYCCWVYLLLGQGHYSPWHLADTVEKWLKQSSAGWLIMIYDGVKPSANTPACDKQPEERAAQRGLAVNVSVGATQKVRNMERKLGL